MTPKQKFIQLMTENAKVDGLTDLMCKIMGILYAEPKEVSLDELAERTGYSLSAISTELRFVEGIGFIKKIKKPKSRKLYFYMEKDFSRMMDSMLKKKYEYIVLRSKGILPEIIKEFKSKKTLSEDEKESLKIVEIYYRQILEMEEMFKKLLEFIKTKRGEK
jgi:DNA-binding transcriptional regulator GbsR (MarR family)